jgi:hypothetical protein
MFPDDLVVAAVHGNFNPVYNGSPAVINDILGERDRVSTGFVADAFHDGSKIRGAYGEIRLIDRRGVISRTSQKSQTGKYKKTKPQGVGSDGLKSVVLENAHNSLL